MSNMMSVENGHKGGRSCPNFETPTVLWKLSNYPSYPPSIPSELFDTALEKCSGSNSTHAGRLPCPPPSARACSECEPPVTRSQTRWLGPLLQWRGVDDGAVN
jgi:hypothetical protein